MVKVNQATYALALRELLEAPCTAHDIVEATGLHTVTAQSLMRTLKQYKVVHISAWDTDSLGRDAIPVYKLGPGRNAKRRKKSAAERQRQSREKKKMAAMVSLRPLVTPGYIPEII